MFLKNSGGSLWLRKLERAPPDGGRHAAVERGGRTMRDEITLGFADIASWEECIKLRHHLCSTAYIEDLVAHARENGLVSEFLGPVAASEVVVDGTNYRESLVARGLSSRCRAVLELIAIEPWFRDPAARIYAAEALTPFALAMRGRFAKFIGSEYVSTESAREALYPIEFQDLAHLTLLSDCFNCVITNDCLEHVPNIPACLSEMLRVLQPGGVMLSTFPFSFRQESETKARLVSGQIEYLTEPEYHGNPAEPEKGSLVFQIPGWDILDAAHAAGFAPAEMVFLSSFERAITGAEIAGVFVMRCYK